MTNAICNEEIMKKVMEVVESKWNELNETKTLREDSQKSKNIACKLIIQIIITFLFTIVYYKIIINPTILYILFTSDMRIPINLLYCLLYTLISGFLTFIISILTSAFS